MVVDGGWWLVIGGWWRLAAVGGWWSLGVVLEGGPSPKKQKQTGSLRAALLRTPTPTASLIGGLAALLLSTADQFVGYAPWPGPTAPALHVRLGDRTSGGLPAAKRHDQRPTCPCGGSTAPYCIELAQGQGCIRTAVHHRRRGGGGYANGTSRRIQHSPGTPTTGLRERGNDTSRSTGRSGRQNAATRRNMRRDERGTVQGPVKKQQCDGMSHRGDTPPLPPPPPPLPMFEAVSQHFALAPSVTRGFTLQNVRPAFGGDQGGPWGEGGGGPSQSPLPFRPPPLPLF